MSHLVCISGWATKNSIWNNLISTLQNPSTTFLNWYDHLDSSDISYPDSIYVGWSIGGLISLKAALTRPPKACILISTTARQIEDSDYPGTPLSIARSLEQGIVENREQALSQFCFMNMHPQTNRPLYDQLYTDSLSIDPKDLIKGSHFLQTTDLRASLKNISCPCLILHGTHDVITPISNGEYLYKNLPSATLVSIPGAGHALPITHHKEISTHIQDFIHGLQP